MASTETDKHVKFFNHEKILVKDMDDITLDNHIVSLRDIVLEGRSRLTAADEEKRNRRSKLTNKGREWLVTDNDVNPLVTDSNVKTRKERMSAADKERERYKKLGMDDSTIEMLLNNIAKAQNPAAPSDHNRVIPDNRPTIVQGPKVVNTQESLLAEISTSLVSGIDSRPVQDLYNAATTAGHIANKLLGPIAKDEPIQSTQLESKDDGWGTL